MGLQKKALRFTLMFTISVMLITTITSFIIYIGLSLKRYDEFSQHLASTTALVCGKENIKKLTGDVMEIYNEQKAQGKSTDVSKMSPEEKEAYQKEYESVLQSQNYKDIYEKTTQLLTNNDVLYLYVNYPDFSSKMQVYIVDGGEGEGTSRPGGTDVVSEAELEKFKANKYKMNAFLTVTKKYGWVCTTLVPLTDENGQFICDVGVDISMNTVVAEGMHFFLILLLLITVITLPISFSALKYIRTRMVAPINQLSEAVGSFVGNQYENNQDSMLSKVQINTGDELQHLCESVQKMGKDVVNYVTEIVSITAEKEHMNAEMNTATQIQISSLPHIFPAFPDDEEIELYAKMLTAKEVGGDFYDFFHIDGDHVALVIGDVSGKGIPGALFMMIAKTIIKNIAMECKVPSEIIKTANMRLCQDNDACMFVTVWFAILQLSTGNLKYVNAGHENPVYKKAGGSFELITEQHDFIVGGIDDAEYQDHELIMHPKDRLFIYTDGIPEANDKDNNMYGTERMLKALNEVSDASDEEIIEHLVKDVEKFADGAEQFDDQTMLEITYLGSAKA
jgi:sigma-B regulation protein RsbU (phosphoserine phosphatase)